MRITISSMFAASAPEPIPVFFLNTLLFTGYFPRQARSCPYGLKYHHSSGLM